MVVELPFDSSAIGKVEARPITSRRFYIDPRTRAACLMEIDTALDTGNLTDGPYTARLETELGRAHGRPAVSTDSGVSALELVLEHLLATPRRIFVPANCFPSLPALAASLGAVLIAAPICPRSLSILADELPVRAGDIVLWVHHCGIVAPEAGQQIARLRGLGCVVIEDNAYVLPDDEHLARAARYRGQVELLSFNPTKPVAGPRGGAIITEFEDLAAMAAQRRNNGGQEMLWRAGDATLRDRRIGEIGAIVSYHQWRRRDCISAKVLATNARYAAAVAQSRVPAMRIVGESSRLPPSRIVVELPAASSAIGVMRRMSEEERIGCAVMYAEPWTDYPCFASVIGADCAGEARALLSRLICLPSHELVSGHHVDRVVASLERIVDAV